MSDAPALLAVDDGGCSRLSFNQDGSCLLAVMDRSFCVVQTLPLAALSVDALPNEGGTGGRLGAMLYQTNNIAVGGTPPDTMYVWDASAREPVICLEHSSPVVAVRLRRDFIAVALARKVHVYTLSAMVKRLVVLETGPNPAGALALATVPPALASSTADAKLLAYPDAAEGSVTIVDLAGDGGPGGGRTFEAHSNAIAFLRFSRDNRLLATASVRGTLVRVWDVETLEMVQELRRGKSQADILSIDFSPGNAFLCVSSNHGTVHIFALGAGGSGNGGGGSGGGGGGGDGAASGSESSTQGAGSNRTSAFSFASGLLSYLSSEWSMSTFSVPGATPAVCAFAASPVEADNNAEAGEEAAGSHLVHVAAFDGSFYSVAFDPSSADSACAAVVESKFLSLGGDDG